MKRTASLLAFGLLTLSTAAVAADWSPGMWTGEETLQFRSDCPDEGEHWSYVWFVVLDGDVWIRLGSQAGGRVDCSQSKPLAAIKIGSELFPSVELVNSPEMAERVAAAMGEKYWTDVFIRYFDHPYTMKLVPKEGAAEPKTE